MYYLKYNYTTTGLTGIETAIPGRLEVLVEPGAGEQLQMGDFRVLECIHPQELLVPLLDKHHIRCARKSCKPLPAGLQQSQQAHTLSTCDVAHTLILYVLVVCQPSLESCYGCHLYDH